MGASYDIFGARSVLKRLKGGLEWKRKKDAIEGAAASAAKKYLTPEGLQAFHAFAMLAYDERLLLADNLELHTLKAGECLFNAGDEDSMDYLLLEGRLRLIAYDGASRELVGGTTSAARVVSSRRPRKHTAEALTDCLYIALDHALLSELCPLSTQAPGGDGAMVEYSADQSPTIHASSIEAAELLDSFYADLRSNRFTLTSIPEVAHKISRAMDEPDVCAASITEIISIDPAIAAKISKAANSALYRGRESCNTLNDAVVRLGLQTTRQLVLSYTMRELFSVGTPALRSALQRRWNRIVYVGAVAAALARRSGHFSPEQGMLAGLLSHVGVLSVFNYLTNYPEIGKDQAKTDATVDELKAEVGALVLERWGFPEALVACARTCEAWQYQHDSSEQPDLCDLVIAASYHANIGAKPLPGVDAVPACHRLLGPDLSPEVAMEFLRDAQQEIDEARALMG